jgi:hypothetical protein
MANQTLTKLKQSFAPEYQALLDSGYTDALARKINETHQLEDPDLVVVRNAFDLYLLFIITEAELQNFLTEEADVPSDTAKAIADAFISDLPTELTSQHQTVYDALRNQPPAKGGGDAIRTMAGDAAAAQGQTETATEADTVSGTSQDDLLKKPPHPDAV